MKEKFIMNTREGGEGGFSLREKKELKEDVQTVLQDYGFAITKSRWRKEFLIIETTNNNKVFNCLLKNYYFNDIVKKKNKIYIKMEK